MDIGSRAWAFPPARTSAVGLALVIALLVTAQAGLSQQLPPPRQDEEFIKAEKQQKATDDWWAQKISAALKEKCRTESVQTAIQYLLLRLDFLEGQLAEWKEMESEYRNNLAASQKEGASYAAISGDRAAVERTARRVRQISDSIAQAKANLKKLEAKPACADESAATQPSAPTPPGESASLPPCGDVSVEIKRLTEEVTTLSREGSSLQATLAKHTSEYNAAARDYPAASPKVVSAFSAVETDQRRVLENRAQMESRQKRILALYGVPPCTPTQQVTAPPTAPSPCYSSANAAQIAAQIAAYQAELDRLTAEYIKLSASPGHIPELTKNTAETAELEKKIGALKDLRPCPDQTRTATPSGPPPGATSPCRTPADDARYMELDAELQRLNAEHDRLFNAAVDKAGQDALRESNRRADDIQRQKEEIRSRPLCPRDPRAVQVPPDSEHGMAPNGPVMPGFGFGFSGGSFGFGGGSDDEQRDRGFRNDRNRRP